MPPDSTTTPVLDAFDRAILAILQRDNTVAQREIARAVHLSAPAVQRRIRRLRDSGVIRAEVILVGAGAVGLDISARGRTAAAEQDHPALHLGLPHESSHEGGAHAPPTVAYVHFEEQGWCSGW